MPTTPTPKGDDLFQCPSCNGALFYSSPFFMIDLDGTFVPTGTDRIVCAGCGSQMEFSGGLFVRVTPTPPAGI